MRSRVTTRFWKTINPLVRPLAGYAPWWLLLETTGRRTGNTRLTPLAGAPLRGRRICVLSVYGDHSAFVRNIGANSTVRVKRRGRWRTGNAKVVDPSPEMTSSLGIYARHVLLRIGRDPKIVQVVLEDDVERRT